MSSSSNNRRNFRFNRKKKTLQVIGPGEFDLEKARHEVFKLGVKGLQTKDKHQAKRDLALRLGAMPKKKKGKNIKQHLEEIREQKLKQREQRNVKSSGQQQNSSAKYHSKQKKRKGLNEVRHMDYQLGTFKNGVQYLTKEDIERLKGKRQFR